MASGYTKFNSILAAIEEELEGENERDDAKPTCRICIGEAKRPVVLSCGHLFCWACITHAADQEAEGQLCPRCKRPHNVQPEDMKTQIKQFRSSYMSWRKGNAKGARGQAKDVVRTQKLLEKPDQKENKFAVRTSLWQWLADDDVPSDKFAVGAPAARPVEATRGVDNGERGKQAGMVSAPLHHKDAREKVSHRDKRRVEAEAKASVAQDRADVFAVAGGQCTLAKPASSRLATKRGSIGGPAGGAGRGEGKFAVGTAPVYPYA